jgi:hypothetical protein
MIGNVMPSLVQMEPELVNNLETEKETTAIDITEIESSDRSFGIVDLWNIRRISRSARNSFRRMTF